MDADGLRKNLNPKAHRRLAQRSQSPQRKELEGSGLKTKLPDFPAASAGSSERNERAKDAFNFQYIVVICANLRVSAVDKLFRRS